MAKRVALCLLTSLVLVVALPARAADDFNSSRSNREKVAVDATPTDASTTVTGPCRPPYLCDTVADPQQAQDFNTTRSNKEKGASKITHVHGDPHVDQITIDEGGLHRGSSSKRVLPTVNKRATAADGPDQDCDGVACPAAPPESASVKGGKTGHVTLNR